jgi:hypothetical protein
MKILASLTLLLLTFCAAPARAEDPAAAPKPCSMAAGARQGVPKEGQPDFSHYDVPLYGQIVERIRTRIAARLGREKVTQDRFFIVPFAYENKGNDPGFSHSFITVIRVFAHGRQRKPHPEFISGTYKGWAFEAYTISWLPADFPEHPDLCVFSGFGARIFAKSNQCPLSPGKSFDLKETLKLAANAKVAVGMWGPYEIAKPGFDLGVKRKRLLDSGAIKYRADDRLYRKNQTAINCFHAMGSLDELFPNGGAFGSGFNMWGLNGTSRVLIEYTTKASNKGLLLEPVNIKKDRYGFVYAPNDGKARIYNPFKNASAYRQ